MNDRSKRCSLRVIVSETVTTDTADASDPANTADTVNPANPVNPVVTANPAADLGKFKQIKLSIQRSRGRIWVAG